MKGTFGMAHFSTMDFSNVARRSESEKFSTVPPAADLRVAQLLCSRLCHDLAGPSGAVHNGVEFMSENGGAEASAVSLIEASASQLNNRLAFYRVAFGLGGGGHQAMTLEEAARLARGAVASHRIELDWQNESGEGGDRLQSLPLDEIRLMLDLILIGSEALPRGGTLGVRCIPIAAGTEVSIVARGPRAGLPEDLLAAIKLDVPSNALTSRTVHGYFAAALASRLGGVVSTETTNVDEVALAATLPRSKKSNPIPIGGTPTTN